MGSSSNTLPMRIIGITGIVVLLMLAAIYAYLVYFQN